MSKPAKFWEELRDEAEKKDRAGAFHIVWDGPSSQPYPTAQYAVRLQGRATHEGMLSLIQRALHAVGISCPLGDLVERYHEAFSAEFGEFAFIPHIDGGRRIRFKESFQRLCERQATRARQGTGPSERPVLTSGSFPRTMETFTGARKPDRPHRKGDVALLKKADGRFYESVDFPTAENYAVISARRRQQLMKDNGHLRVVGKGQNRRITVVSLIAYCPPTEDAK